MLETMLNFNIKPKSYLGTPGNAPSKFGSNWSRCLSEKDWNVKSLQTTDEKWWESLTLAFAIGELIKVKKSIYIME